MDTNVQISVDGEWSGSYTSTISCGEAPMREWTTFIEGVGYFGIVQYESSGYRLLLSKYIDIPAVVLALLLTAVIGASIIASFMRRRTHAA